MKAVVSGLFVELKLMSGVLFNFLISKKYRSFVLLFCLGEVGLQLRLFAQRIVLLASTESGRKSSIAPHFTTHFGVL